MENANGLDGFTEDEIEVVKTLRDLEETHNKTWYMKWARRCKRSGLDLDEAEPPSIQQTEKPSGGGACETRVSAGPEAEARANDSPVSPLEFAGFPVVSDDKDNPRPTKVAKTTTRKDCVEMIRELTETKQVLIGEIENVRKHHNNLKVYNSELKAMKEEVLNKKEEPPQTGINLTLELSQYYQTPLVMPHHRQPCIPDPTVQSFLFAAGPQAQVYPPNNGLGSLNHTGPRGFDLDLNQPAPEEAFAADAYAATVEQHPPPQPSDEMMEIADRRARSADARRRRKGMMKIKNMRSACGIRLPAADGS